MNITDNPFPEGYQPTAQEVSDLEHKLKVAEEALEKLLNRYISSADSELADFYNVERDTEVKTARAALSLIHGEAK